MLFAGPLLVSRGYNEGGIKLNQSTLVTYRKLGGWIAGFAGLLALILLRGFIELVDFRRTLAGADMQIVMNWVPSLKTLVNSVTIFMALYLIAIGACLAFILMRKKNFSKYAVISLPVLSLLQVIVYSVGMRNVQREIGVTESVVTGEMITTIIYTAVIAVAWVMYLQKSERAKVYFADEPTYQNMLSNAPSVAAYGMPAQAPYGTPQQGFGGAPQGVPGVAPQQQPPVAPQQDPPQNPQ